jgi:3',5'-cyclic AMP phosphodiesterase CpdA
MHAERTLRLAHLSDLHLPLLFRGGWDARWRRLAAALGAEAPDAVVVTGDLVNSGFPAARLERALREMERLLSAAAPGAELVVVPGNHDLKLLGLGPSQGDARAAVERVFGGRALVGANASRVLRGLVHLVGADSNAASFLAQGRVDGAIAIPGRCDAPHVHVLLLHHHLHPEPPRAGENAVTSSHAGLRLVDAPEARRAILAAGFQLVLHGHRHLTTAYREAEVDGFSDPVHFVGAPSGTARAWPGFNLVDFFDDHTFRVAAVERTQDAWRPPYTLAVRPYEAVKAGRRAAARRAVRFEADLAEVEVWTGDRGTGDVRFRIALEGVVAHERAVPFPARIVPYAGAYLRGVTARWSRAGAASDLQVDGSGRFLLEHIPEPSAIEVTGTIANALPAAPGDWVRMQASDPDLAHLFAVQLASVARVLRIRLRVPFAPLAFIPVAEGGGAHRPVDAELAYALAERDDDAGETSAVVFWPDPGVAYAFSADGAQLGVDDRALADLARAESERTATLRRRVEELATASDDSRVALQVEEALGALRAGLLALSRERSGGLARDEDGLMVNLMSTPGALRARGGGASGLRVVATDEHTAVVARERRAGSPLGTTLPWGAGVVGRALRSQSWAAWSRRGCEGHPMTWRAEEPYHALAGAPVHEHMLCGPLVHDDAAFAMLSLATYDRNSALVDALAALTGGGEAALALFDLFEALQERLVAILLGAAPGVGGEGEGDVP